MGRYEAAERGGVLAYSLLDQCITPLVKVRHARREAALVFGLGKFEIPTLPEHAMGVEMKWLKPYCRAEMNLIYSRGLTWNVLTWKPWLPCGVDFGAQGNNRTAHLRAKTWLRFKLYGDAESEEKKGEGGGRGRRRRKGVAH